MVIACHDTQESFNAIIHMHERTRLLAVAPNLDLARIVSKSYLAADGRWCFFLAAVIGAERTVDIVETRDAGLELIVLPVVAAELFGIQLFPTIARLGLSRKSILFAQRFNIRILL